MQPILSLDRTALAVLIDGTVHVMLELRTPEAPVAERAPIDTVVVIDRSGSMSGAPLDAVTRATADLIKLAGADDRIGVVAFDSDVTLVLPLARHDSDRAAATVRAIRPGGNTNLSGGWLKAMEMLSADRRPAAVTRILLLTDGHANAGIVEPAQLHTLASAAKRDGITTTCIGFADGYDQQLLAGMADAGGGNDYWCAGPDQAGTVFRTEFAGLASLVAQNVSVELQPASNVDDYAVLNEFPITAVPGGVQIALGDSYGGERRRVVAMLHVTPQQQEGVLEVAQLVLRYASVGESVGLHTVTIPVTVQIGGDADTTAENPEVVEQVRLLRAASARRDASRLADRGDMNGAAELLEMSVSLLSLTSIDESEISELRTDAARLRRHEWDERSSKKHFAANREVQRSRASRFDKPVPPDEQQP